MFLVTHPLYSHRHARIMDRSKIGGICSRIVCTVMAVAARTFDMNAVHLLWWELDQLRYRSAQREHSLAVAPHGEPTVGQKGKAAGRSDRRMHLVRAKILFF